MKNSKLKALIFSLISWFLNFFLPDSGIKKTRILRGPLKGLILELDFKRQKAYWLGVYERSVLNICREIIMPGDIIYDIGAYIGYFSLMFSRLCGEKGMVIAFEPDPENFRILNNNIQLNNIKNIISRKSAVFSSNGPMKFDVSYSASQKRLSNGQKDKVIMVETETLDNFYLQHQDLPPRVIKIDIEGFEKEAILGMDKILMDCKPIIICEIHDKENEKIVKNKLMDFDYKILDIGLDNYLRITNHSFPIWGIIAVPKQKEYLIKNTNKL